MQPNSYLDLPLRIDATMGQRLTVRCGLCIALILDDTSWNNDLHATMRGADESVRHHYLDAHLARDDRSASTPAPRAGQQYVAIMRVRGSDTLTWGPFANVEDARAFADVMERAVDPVEILPLRSAGQEMMSNYMHEFIERQRTAP